MKNLDDLVYEIEKNKALNIHVVVQQSEQLFCDCYIKYPRGKGDCYKCGLGERP